MSFLISPEAPNFIKDLGFGRQGCGMSFKGMRGLYFMSLLKERNFYFFQKV